MKRSYYSLILDYGKPYTVEKRFKKKSHAYKYAKRTYERLTQEEGDDGFPYFDVFLERHKHKR